jgi:hypothetical protein
LAKIASETIATLSAVTKIASAEGGNVDFHGASLSPAVS